MAGASTLCYSLIKKTKMFQEALSISCKKFRYFAGYLKETAHSNAVANWTGRA
jgi:hypothetical protein